MICNPSPSSPPLARAAQRHRRVKHLSETPFIKKTKLFPPSQVAAPLASCRWGRKNTKKKAKKSPQMHLVVVSLAPSVVCFVELVAFRSSVAIPLSPCYCWFARIFVCCLVLIYRSGFRSSLFPLRVHTFCSFCTSLLNLFGGDCCLSTFPFFILSLKSGRHTHCTGLRCEFSFQQTTVFVPPIHSSMRHAIVNFDPLCFFSMYTNQTSHLARLPCPSPPPHLGRPLFFTPVGAAGGTKGRQPQKTQSPHRTCKI